MILLTIAVLLLFSAAAIMAVAGTLRSSHSSARKTVFIVLRIAIALLFIVAFLEPVLTIHRVPRQTPRLTVLVDASTSMSLFSDDTAVDALLNRISTAAAARGTEAGIMLFGDSLREKNAITPYHAADRSSVFPSENDLAAKKPSAGILILSDGNWSNAAPVVNGFDGKPVWYLPLRQQRFPAALDGEAPDTVIMPANTKHTISQRCAGAINSPSVITISLQHQAAVISTDTIVAGPGPFARTIAVTLPPQPAGMRRYRLTFDCGIDSLSRVQYMVCRSVPAVFGYTVVSGSPSLDERFLRLALARNGAYREADNGPNAREQVRFILHQPQAPLPPPHVVPVYIGCLPVAASPHGAGTAAARFLVPGTPDNPLDGFELADAPPVVPLRALRPVDVVTPWLYAVSGNDTLPLLFGARLRGRPYLACAFDHLWQWDFLPLSHRDGEADAGQFSRRLLAITATELIAGAADTLLTWPVDAPAAFAELKVAVITPRCAPDGKDPPILRCSITGTGVHYDTAIGILPDGPQLQYLMLPPMQRGVYRMNSSLSINGKTFTDSLSFAVTANDHELLVNGPNSALLGETGQPVDTGDTFLAPVFEKIAAVRDSAPVGQRLPLRRSWWLLGALLLFFGVEWLLRRLWNLE
jgi:hypothetical protein